MDAARPSVHRFLLRVVLWLPPSFLLWYLLAEFWLYPIGWGLDWIFPRFLPSVIQQVEHQGHLMEVVTRITPSQPVPGAQAGVLSFEINPLIYSYSLPLYAGLTLAAPAHSARRKAAYLLAGLIALLPFIFWGASFETLKILAFTMGSDTASYVDFSGIRRQLIGWGYQFGYLILPGVMPLAVWIALHRDFLGDLAPGLSPPKSTEG